MAGGSVPVSFHSHDAAATSSRANTALERPGRAADETRDVITGAVPRSLCAPPVERAGPCRFEPLVCGGQSQHSVSGPAKNWVRLIYTITRKWTSSLVFRDAIEPDGSDFPAPMSHQGSGAEPAYVMLPCVAAITVGQPDSHPPAPRSELNCKCSRVALRMSELHPVRATRGRVPVHPLAVRQAVAQETSDLDTGMRQYHLTQRTLWRRSPA